MKLSPRARFFLKVVGGLVLAIQFIQIFPRTNPPTITRLPWDSPTTEAFARASCFDCHSNETRWPWYSYIAPVSWVIVRDVNQGREQLNFSELTSDDGPGPLIKRINNNSMPPPKYLALHPEARIDDKKKPEFIAGLRRTFEHAAP